MSALVSLQTRLRDALRELPHLNGVPVLSEVEGDALAERDVSLAKKHLAVVVGAASFDPQSRDSRVITGRARVVATVYEQPTRNRIGQSLVGPTVTSAAECIACAAHLLPFDGGVLVFAGIGGVVRVDDKTVARDVSFETLTTLTGEG